MQRTSPHDFTHPPNSLGHILIPAFLPYHLTNTYHQQVFEQPPHLHVPLARHSIHLRGNQEIHQDLKLLHSCLGLCQQEYSPVARADGKWSTKGCFHVRWQETLVQLLEIGKNHEGMRMVFKYCFPSYAELQIFRIVHNSSGWVQILVLSLGLFWHQDSTRMQGDITAGHQCQPLPYPCGSTGQLTLHTAAKVMGIGWTKTPTVREIFISNLIQKESEVHRTKYSHLYFFVGKAAATGACFDKRTYVTT